MIEEPPKLTIRRDAPRPTEAQMAPFRGIPTGMVCDAMEGMGALDMGIRPLDPIDPARHVVGPALVAENGPTDILATLAAVTLAQPGDVVVVSVAGWQGCASAGDQVMGQLRNAEAAGFVSDGPVRDYDGVMETGVPVWCTGLNPNSPYAHGPGRVGGAAVVGGVRIASGDLIVADCNGVVVVPFARLEAVAAKLAEVKRLEDDLESQVAEGFRTPLDLDAMLADGTAVAEG